MAVPTAPSYQPWGTLPPVSQTCFQIYGTKRKATLSECSNTHEQISPSVKRHCFHPFSQCQIPVEQSQPSAHPHPASSSPCQQNMTASPCQPHSVQDLFQATVQQPTTMQVESTNSVRSECNPSQTLTQGFCSNSVHSIQSSDTTTSVGSLNIDGSQSEPGKPLIWQHKENDQRLIEHRNQRKQGMLQEFEFESNDYWDVPYDHHLLKMADEIERARIAMETDNSVSHQQSSGVSTSDATLFPATVPLEIHNAGNHIRCYCKPSWEGLLEPVSYI